MSNQRATRRILTSMIVVSVLGVAVASAAPPRVDRAAVVTEQAVRVSRATGTTYCS